VGKGDSLSLSISLREGKENKRDSPSSGE